MLEFIKFSSQKEGTIFSLLSRCYKEYFNYDSNCEMIWKQSWAEYDKSVFKNPDTIGGCGFFSRINEKIVGFASWDPRGYPHGRIGHNCILPEFTGNSYGTEQIKRIIQILSEKKFKSILAKTGDHIFFESARKMYKACGFEEQNKHQEQGCSKYGTIDFEYNFKNN